MFGIEAVERLVCHGNVCVVRQALGLEYEVAGCWDRLTSTVPSLSQRLPFLKVLDLVPALLG